METVKKLSPALFGLIIICFFLPFVNLSCSGQTIMSLSGFQLMTGADMKPNNNMFGGMEFSDQNVSKEEKIDPQPMAILAFIAAIAGLALSFLKKKSTAITAAIFSGLGFVFLILLKISMDSDADISGQYIITLEYKFGYWLSLALFIAGAVISWQIYREPEYVNVPQNEIPTNQSM